MMQTLFLCSKMIMSFTHSGFMNIRMKSNASHSLFIHQIVRWLNFYGKFWRTECIPQIALGLSSWRMVHYSSTQSSRFVTLFQEAVLKEWVAILLTRFLILIFCSVFFVMPTVSLCVYFALHFILFCVFLYPKWCTNKRAWSASPRSHGGLGALAPGPRLRGPTVKSLCQQPSNHRHSIST